MKECINAFCIDMQLNIGDLITAVIALAALIAAIFIGVKQNNINKRMLDLQDVVDVYLTANRNQLKIYNISTQAIYIDKYSVCGKAYPVPPYRLPPASLYPDAHYRFDLTCDGSEHVSYEIYINDSLNRKWSVTGYADKIDGCWEVSCEKPKEVR